MVLLCFGWSPLVFHCFFGSRIGSERKTKGKLLENQSPPTPGPLRSFLLSLSLLWPPGLLWLALAPSFLSLFPVTRNKEELRLWGLSGASVWASPSSVSLGSSGWLWPSPSSLCLLLCLVTKKFYSGPSPELPSPSGPLPHLSFLFHALRREEKTYSGLPWTCSGPDFP